MFFVRDSCHNGLFHLFSLEINGEASVQLRVTVLPAHATDPSVTWSSSDPSVASVDGNGLVTIRKKGKVRITVSANDGSGVSTHCDIEVISTVANEEVSAQNVYAYGGRLYLTLSRSEQVRIYHLNGQLLHVFRALYGRFGFNMTLSGMHLNHKEGEYNLSCGFMNLQLNG